MGIGRRSERKCLIRSVRRSGVQASMYGNGCGRLEDAIPIPCTCLKGRTIGDTTNFRYRQENRIAGTRMSFLAPCTCKKLMSGGPRMLINPAGGVEMNRGPGTMIVGQGIPCSQVCRVSQWSAEQETYHLSSSAVIRGFLRYCCEFVSCGEGW